MGKGLLVIILGTLMTMVIVSMNLMQTANAGFDNAVGYFEEIQTRNVGNSMINMILTRIADSASYRTEDDDFEVKPFFSGEIAYRVSDTALVVDEDLIKIEVVVVYHRYPEEDIIKEITIYTRQPVVGGWVPPPVRAAWTTNGDVNNTISDMYVDGRDHDLNLNIIPGTGMPGITTSVEFRNDDNASIAGTYDSVDYKLSYPEDEDIIEDNYDWDGAFPTTPDEILGYPEGTLKTLAQSGAGGGQYIIDPSLPGGKALIDTTHLSFPLSGVTYVELTDGIERELRMYGEGNGGILVVHGPNTSSRLKGLKIEPWIPPAKAPKRVDGDPWDICHHPGEISQEDLTIADISLADHLGHGDMQNFCPELDSSWFQGLIVTDFSFHHHLDILGAMLQLSPDLETDKNCIGNQDHWVKYSAAAIKAATGFTAEESGEAGNSDEIIYNEIGFGNGRQKANFWFE